MRFAWYIFLVLSIAGPAALGQHLGIDSLTGLLNRAEGTTRVDILNQLTFEHLTNDNTLAMKYCDQSLVLSQKLGYKKGEGVALAYRGVYEYLSREFSSGRADLRSALKLAIEADDRSTQGYALMQLGSSFLDQAILDTALFHFNNAYEILKDSANPVTLSKLYRNLSILYGLKADYDLQDKYMVRCLNIREKLGDKTFIADGLIVLAGFRIRSGDYAQAKVLLSRAGELLKSSPKDLDDLNDLRHQKALILLREKKFDEAMVLFDSARSYYLRTALLLKFVTLQKDLGKVFLDRGEYEVALKTLYEGLRVAKLKGYGFEVMDIQLQLGWVNYQLGELNLSLAFTDSIYVRVKSKDMPNRIADALTLKGVVLTEFNDYAQAKSCLEQAMAIWQKQSNKPKLSEAYLNLAYLEENHKNYSRAQELYNQSYSLAELSDYDLGKAWSLSGLGSVKLHLNHFNEVEPLLAQAENYAKGIAANEILVRVYQIRRDLFAAEGRYKEALFFAVKSNELKDSIHRKDLARRFVSLQRIDEIEERDRNIKTLTQDQQLAQEKITMQDLKLNQQYILIITAGLGLALVGTLAFMYWRFYRRIKRLNHSIRSNNKRIQQQANELLRAHNELGRVYKAVKEQKEEIEAQADALTKSNNQISELNKNLEGLVAEKTSDLQKSNEELIRNNHDLLQFSYSLSHNLRGPVARLLGLTDILRYSSSKEELDRMTAMVNKTSKDLDLVVNDLSKVLDSQNDLYNTKEVVSLPEAWSNSYALLQNVIPQKFKITSDFNKAQEVIAIKTIIQSVFYNLLSNAIKYRSPDRDLTVNVSSQRHDGKLILEIRDNGLGIDLEKYRDSMFKLFKRFHTHIESRGIGLYLIKSQLEGLRGTIEVESEIDRGTLFRVTIPDPAPEA